jgi:hypothetical protein
MVLQDSWTETQDTESVLQEQDFIVLAQAQWTHVQRLSPDNKGALPYIPLQAGYRSKKQPIYGLHTSLFAISTLSATRSFSPLD